jgi:hypothetical protein
LSVYLDEPLVLVVWIRFDPSTDSDRVPLVQILGPKKTSGVERD